MTAPDLAARVAALLDAGNPGHVRDLFEDLAAEVGEAEARRGLSDVLLLYWFGCVVSDGPGRDRAGQARRLYGEIKPAP